MFVTADAVAFWAERRSPGQYETYWAAVAQPHRVALVRALHTFPKFTSLREVGCSVGTNLQLVRNSFPWVDLSGSDINVGAIAFGQDHLPDAEFSVGSIMDDSSTWLPRSFDIIISCYALAYVSPDDISTFVDRACVAAKLGLVFAEPFGNGESVRAVFPQWHHNYQAVVAGAITRSGRKARLRTGNISPTVDRCDGLITVLFEGETT